MLSSEHVSKEWVKGWLWESTAAVVIFFFFFLAVAYMGFATVL